VITLAENPILKSAGSSLFFALLFDSIRAPVVAAQDANGLFHRQQFSF
jgi:hypothetical protein